MLDSLCFGIVFCSYPGGKSLCKVLVKINIITWCVLVPQSPDTFWPMQGVQQVRALQLLQQHRRARNQGLNPLFPPFHSSALPSPSNQISNITLLSSLIIPKAFNIHGYLYDKFAWFFFVSSWMRRMVLSYICISSFRSAIVSFCTFINAERKKERGECHLGLFFQSCQIFFQ